MLDQDCVAEAVAQSITRALKWWVVVVAEVVGGGGLVVGGGAWVVAESCDDLRISFLFYY